MATGGCVLGQNRGPYACVLLFLFISVVLQLSGLIAPGWVVFDLGSRGSIKMGLFLYTVCERDGCTTEYIDKHAPNPDLVNNLEEYRGETITALVAGAIAAVVTCRLHCVSAMEHTTRMIHLVVLIVALVLSGSLSMAASGKWGRNLIKVREQYSDSSILKTPYALILTGVGGLIAALLFLVIARITCQLYNKRHDVPRSQQHQTASNQQPQSAVGQPYIVHAPSQGQLAYAPPVYSSVVPSAPPLHGYTDLHHHQHHHQQQQQQHGHMNNQLELQHLQNYPQYR